MAGEQTKPATKPRTPTWKRFLGVLRYTGRAIELVSGTSRGLTIALFSLTLVAGLVPAAIAWVGKGLVDAVVCREGRAADVLCEVATERRAGLILIGTHGYDRVDRVLGTTAARVTNMAPCSVLVVRPDE